MTAKNKYDISCSGFHFVPFPAHAHKIHGHMAFRMSYIHLPPFGIKQIYVYRNVFAEGEQKKERNGIAALHKEDANNQETWQKIAKFKLQYCNATHLIFVHVLSIYIYIGIFFSKLWHKFHSAQILELNASQRCHEWFRFGERVESMRSKNDCVHIYIFFLNHHRKSLTKFKQQAVIQIGTIKIQC